MLHHPKKSGRSLDDSLGLVSSFNKLVFNFFYSGRKPVKFGNSPIRRTGLLGRENLPWGAGWGWETQQPSETHTIQLSASLAVGVSSFPKLPPQDTWEQLSDPMEQLLRFAFVLVVLNSALIFRNFGVERQSEK